MAGDNTGTEEAVEWSTELPSLDVFPEQVSVESITKMDSKYVVKATSDMDSSTALQAVYSQARDEGFDADCSQRGGQLVFVFKPLDTRPSRQIPLVLFGATVGSTLIAGGSWYDVSPFSVDAVVVIPFVLAVLGVLGVHEMGHYLASRYYNVRSSLPYFLPVPTLIGTMGAVIRMRGRIPNRKALFDIGIAGPLFGLVATCLVAIVGLYLPPVSAPSVGGGASGELMVSLGYPPLLQFFAWVTGQQLVFDGSMMVNPVVVGAWVGMFVTFLNLLPVGQLDGGHILRAMVGEQQETVGTAVPLALFALSLWVYQRMPSRGNAVLLWGVWGVFTFFFMAGGAAEPVYEDVIGWKRVVLGVVTFVLGVLCFTPVPIQLV